MEAVVPLWKSVGWWRGNSEFWSIVNPQRGVGKEDEMLWDGLNGRSKNIKSPKLLSQNCTKLWFTESLEILQN